MTELDLYKFITENKIEWHWEDHDVIIFILYHQIEDFRKIASPGLFDDDGVECRMKDGYFAFYMANICEHYGIDTEKVFPKDKELAG